MSTSAVPKPPGLFLGYCYKEFPLSSSHAWHADPRVRRIASVTECNLARPDGWIEQWDFNDAGLYDTPEAAKAARDASGDPGEFHLFAYEFYPLRFDETGNGAVVDASAIFNMNRHPLPATRANSDGLSLLGFDAVERWAEAESMRTDVASFGGFGCSPLFCNLQATSHPVNENCLLDTWEDACKAARIFAIGPGAEPGNYYIFGVYGERF